MTTGAAPLDDVSPILEDAAVAGVVWVEFESRDPEMTMAFFVALFGWEFDSAFADTDLGADYWLVRAGAEVIGGLQASAAESPAPRVGTRVYLEVDDLEQVLRRAVQLGGRIERARTELGGDDRWFAIIAEPTGVSLGLWTDQAASGRQ